VRSVGFVISPVVSAVNVSCNSWNRAGALRLRGSVVAKLIAE
jgi:hypothetical protein